MLKKIIAAVLSVLTALCLALPAFAVRNINDTDSTYESMTAGAGLRESEPKKYTFTIDGLNDNALYYEKLLSFVALGDDGEEYPVTVWVEKESPNGYFLLLTKEDGDLYPIEGCIQEKKHELPNRTETYTLIFYSSKLTIETPGGKYREYTLMSDIDNFEEITVINKKVKKIASPVQSSETDAEPVTGAIQASGTTVGNNENTKGIVSTTAADKDNDGGSVSKSTMMTIVVLVLVLVIVLIVLAVCILGRGNVAGIKKIFKNILSKVNKQPAREKQPHKKKNSEQPQPNGRSKTEPNYRSKALPPNIETSTPKRTAKSSSNIDVPVNNAPEPIAYDSTVSTDPHDSNDSIEHTDAKYDGVDTRDKNTLVKKLECEELADAIDSIYKKENIYKEEMPPELLKRDVISAEVHCDANSYLGIENGVRLNMCSDNNNGSFIVVDNRYLFLNFYVFGGRFFIASESIAGLSKCFDLISGNRKVNANNQKIKKLIPAEVHVENSQFVLDKKGEIYLED